MLVRVDISAARNGVLSVALSHQAAGFAPYRIDNCTAATLHLRQVLPFSMSRDMAISKANLSFTWHLLQNTDLSASRILGLPNPRADKPQRTPHL